MPSMTVDNLISAQYRKRLLTDLKHLEQNLSKGCTLARMDGSPRDLVMKQVQQQIRHLEGSESSPQTSYGSFSQPIGEPRTDLGSISTEPLPASGFLIDTDQLHRAAYGLPCTVPTHCRETLVRAGVSAMAQGDLSCARSIPSWVESLSVAGKWTGPHLAEWVQIGRFMSNNERIKETVRLSGCDAATIVDCTLDAFVPFFHTVACPSCFDTQDIAVVCEICARRSRGLCASTIGDDSHPRETAEGWISSAQYIDGFISLVNTASEEDLSAADNLMECYSAITHASNFSHRSNKLPCLKDVLNFRFVQGATAYILVAVPKPVGPVLELWERCQHSGILWNDAFDIGYDIREGGSLNTALYCHNAGLGLDHVAFYLRGLVVEAIDHFLAYGDSGPLRALLYSIAYHYSCARYCHWIELGQVCNKLSATDEYGVRNWVQSPENHLYMERRHGFLDKLAAGVQALGGASSNVTEVAMNTSKSSIPYAVGTMAGLFYRGCSRGPNGGLIFPWADILSLYAECVSVAFDPVGLAHGWSRLALSQNKTSP